MVIDLEVRRFLDLEAFERGLQLFSFRRWTRVQFQSLTGWSAVLPALIDTGAPFCVLPKTIWTTLHVPRSFPTNLRRAGRWAGRRIAATGHGGGAGAG